ncbi:MAG: amidohydrolase family protein [Anaerorhabdus sp.]|uniref:amidohydrolase n=1 Tax=Anaerorhabdus sp. TaxID=1872524 RepID=UPI002FCAE708
MKTTIINAKIYTANPDMPYAKSISFEDGYFTEVSTENLNGDTLLDAENKLIIPALLDIHMHPIWIAENINKLACVPPKINSIEDLKQGVKHIRATRGNGKWILGWGFDEGKMKENRICTKEDLDKACFDCPVIIERTCNHICVCNTSALLALNINPANHNGILKEKEKFDTFNRIPPCSKDELTHNIAKLSNDLFSKGITTISEMLGTPDTLRFYDEAMRTSLGQRLAFAYDYHQIKNTTHLPSPRNSRIRIQGVKILSDGSVSGQTAWCSTPYLNTDNYGNTTITDEEFIDAQNIAKRHNIQLIVHAMGDKAIEKVIRLKADDWLEDMPSLRIEHYAIVKDHLLEETKKKNIAVVSQPIFVFAEIESYLKNLGSSFKDYCYPYKKILENKIQLAFSSDAPATSWADPVNPFVAMKSACQRQSYSGYDTGFEECIPITTAIDLYTREASKVLGVESLGQIKKGYLADFIVLDRDILTDQTTLQNTQVLETYMSGKQCYKRK